MQKKGLNKRLLLANRLELAVVVVVVVVVAVELFVSAINLVSHGQFTK